MQYDIAILGGGPGGYVAAVRAAQLGAKVAVVEKDELGGTCLNRGCIPTKALVAGAGLLNKLSEAEEFGIEVSVNKVSLEKMIARKDAVVQQLVKGIHFLFQKNKINLITGAGKLVSPTEIAVLKEDGETEVIQAKNIILATGSEPALISALGYDGKNVLTSTEALEMTEIPESILIIGGGVIGCEFACIYQALGVKVTIVEAMANILPLIEKEAARQLQSLLKKRGIEIHTKVMIEKVEINDGKVRAFLNNGQEIQTDKALISIGRSLNTKELGFEEVGINLGTRGEVVVDEHLRTSIPTIFAIGDITNKMQLAHVASAQGIAAVNNIMGENHEMDYRVVPSCIFTFPEVATVGITTEQAKEAGLNIKSAKFPFMAIGKAVAMGEKDGFVKIITDADNDEVIGVHIVGPHATDLIAEAALAMQKRLTAHEIAQTIHAHPTVAEAIMEAAEAVHGMAIHG